MPTISAVREIDASPSTIWRALITLEEWPEWSPLVQSVRFDDPAQGFAGEWFLNGILGRAPYNGKFRLIEHIPLERLIFTSITVTTPYDYVRHDIRLSREGALPRLTWTVSYGTRGGPGGWIVDWLLIRRQATELLERGLAALASEVSQDLGS